RGQGRRTARDGHDVGMHVRMSDPDVHRNPVVPGVCFGLGPERLVFAERRFGHGGSPPMSGESIPRGPGLAGRDKLGAPNFGGDAMPQTHRDLARRWFEEVWNARRDAAVHELLAENAVAHMEGADLVGPERFLEARAALVGAFPNIRVTVEDVVADVDRA